MVLDFNRRAEKIKKKKKPMKQKAKSIYYLGLYRNHAN